MRKEKQLLLDEIQEKIDAATAMIITRYDRMEPNASWEFRNQLAKQGSLFEVVRKRIFMKAAQNSGVALDESLLSGHIGVLFVNQTDAMAPTKTLFKFSEDNGDLFQVVCGQIEGKILPGKEVEVLSKLPGMDELRSQMLSLFTAPMSGLLGVMEAVMSGPLSILKQKSE